MFTEATVSSGFSFAASFFSGEEGERIKYQPAIATTTNIANAINHFLVLIIFFLLVIYQVAAVVSFFVLLLTRLLKNQCIIINSALKQLSGNLPAFFLFQEEILLPRLPVFVPPRYLSNPLHLRRACHEIFSPLVTNKCEIFA
jgi:hypothetical protein